MKCLMPNFLINSRLASMLMPYLVLYRLSKCFSLSQGKLSQAKQYLALEFTIFSQFLILHSVQDFDLRLSSPRQPGHGFRSLVNARHRRQFIPQGAISFVEIVVVFVDLFDIITRSGNSYVRTRYLSSTTKSASRRIISLYSFFPHSCIMAKSTSPQVLYKSRNPYI